MGVKYITPFLFVHFLLRNKKMDSSQGRESPVNSRGEAAQQHSIHLFHLLVQFQPTFFNFCKPSIYLRPLPQTLGQ